MARSTDTNWSFPLENNCVTGSYGFISNATNNVIPVSATTLESIDRDFYVHKSLIKIDTNWFNLFKCYRNTFW